MYGVTKDTEVHVETGDFPIGDLPGEFGIFYFDMELGVVRYDNAYDVHAVGETSHVYEVTLSDYYEASNTYTMKVASGTEFINSYNNKGIFLDEIKKGDALRTMTVYSDGIVEEMSMKFVEKSLISGDHDVYSMYMDNGDNFPVKLANGKYVFIRT